MVSLVCCDGDSSDQSRATGVFGTNGEMFNTKLEDVASTSQAVSPRPNPLKIQKINIQANDIKLKGTKNYLSWSRRAMLLLQAKGLQKYVRTSCTEPADKQSDE